MRKLRCNWRSIAVAACASALASVLIVAVGPGFSSPNDSAADQATEATESNASTSTDETSEVTTTSEGAVANGVAGSTNDGVPNGGGNGDDTPENASTSPDSHGHIGSGTGTTTGSQADPGHQEDTDGTDGKSNGDGLGDDPAAECTNDRHQGADAPQGGANYNPGPYDNTCDGRISQNGQGDDANGAGTACAGCVGNADDRNPPGQVKEFDGTKSNDMGYECDGNQGVGAHYGNGNPAHTGDCGGTVTTPPTCPAGTDKEGMEIPAGETTEWCDDGPPPPSDVCPEGTDKEGMEIPAGQDESWCDNGPPPPSDVCPEDTDKEGMEIPAGQDEDWCDNPPPTPDTCPAGSDKEGMEIPPGQDLDWCDNGPPPPSDVCPEDTDKEGMEIPPGQDEDWCDNGPPSTSDVCPAGSDKEGHEIPPGQDEDWCDVGPTPRDTCPAGTDKAGMEIPPGQDDDWCDTGQDHFSICHATGSTTNPYVIIPNISQEGLLHHLANHPDDVYPVPAGGVEECADAPETEVCPLNSSMPGVPVPGTPPNVANCFIVSPPPVCPIDSDMPGQQLPGGDINRCFLTPPLVCPADSSMPGQPIPGGDVANCYTANPPLVCPVGSDLAGQPMPGGDIRRCYTDTPVPTVVCPVGTDRAGQPMPDGDIRDCNDDVLGEIIDREKPKDDVLGNRDGAAERPATRGRVLPFTGASILAYLVLALEMLGAGALLMRARKRR